MGAPAMEFAWTEASDTVTGTELAREVGFTPDEMRELLDYGALHPLPFTGAAPVFSAEAVPALREAARLRRDFDLDLFAVAVLVRYLDRIEVLQRQVRLLQAQLPFHAPPAHREGPQPWREPHG